MTKHTYTKDAPFEFEGMRVWPSTNVRGSLDILGAGGRSCVHEDEARAIHAFIEAERNADQDWLWTNDEHTEARKGRWTVKQVEGRTLVQHDDMGLQVLARHDSISGEHTDAAADIAREFAAWHAAQKQPAEPTGLGAVVEVDGIGFVRVREGNLDARPWLRVTTGTHRAWAEVCEFGPVTILSQGVE